jgi:sarcosine oxidase subunit beta
VTLRTWHAADPKASSHVIERQLAAVIELVPVFAYARLLRSWAGVVDECSDASSVVGPTPIPGPSLNAGWGTGALMRTVG